jgi:hypothetical protein
MEICIHFGGQTHCFIIPILELPWHFPGPGPGPVNYPQLFADGILVASMRNMAEKVADAGARQALQQGVAAAQEAMQKHAGSDVTIRAAAGGLE